MLPIDKILDKVKHLDRSDLERHFSEMGAQLKTIRAATDAMPEGVLVADAHMRILFMNRSARTILGIPDSSKKKWTLLNVIRDPQLKTVVTHAVSESSFFVNREIQILTPRSLTLEVTMIPLEETSDTGGYALMLTDATFLRASERNERKQEKTKSILALAQAVAHEIGNPLNAIGIQLRLLQKDAARLPDKDKRRIGRTTDILLEETQRLDRIIRQFLALSRTPVPRFRKVNINDVVRDIASFLAPELKSKKIAYALELSKEIPVFLADGPQLYRAFLNLAKNAIEAMPDGGRLIVRTDRNDKLVTIAFQDEGMGIPKSERDQIFDFYYTTKPTGSGLGLSIVEKIVEEHGGRVACESEEGEGTTFTVTLPIRQHRLELPPAPSAERSGP